MFIGDKMMTVTTTAVEQLSLSLCLSLYQRNPSTNTMAPFREDGSQQQVCLVLMMPNRAPPSSPVIDFVPSVGHWYVIDVTHIM
jgi:hypothetical protein